MKINKIYIKLMLSLILLSCENDLDLSINNVTEPTVTVEKK